MKKVFGPAGLAAVFLVCAVGCDVAEIVESKSGPKAAFVKTADKIDVAV